jgi:hypothetical protein
MTKTKFLRVKDMKDLLGLLIDLSPQNLRKCVEEIEETIQRAQTIHKNADTKARQIWRGVVASNRK